MSSPFGRLHIMLNPRAGRGAMSRAWPAVRDALAAAGLEADVTVTKGPGHATEATRHVVESGGTFIVAVGGDGTVHEVVNGMMGSEKPLNPDAVLGVVPAGTGCDFVKTFGLPPDPVAAAAHLAGDALWGRLDIARVECAGRAGSQTTRWFANVGEAGLGAAVVARASRMPKRLGGSVYRFAALREIVGLKATNARIEMHGRKARGTPVDAPLLPIVHEGLLDLLVVANGQFFGGGMKVAPRAIPEDDMLDVLVAGPLKRGQAVRLMQRMFDASHVPSPLVAEYLASRVTVATARPIPVEVDGEVVGTTPATFDLCPAAIPLKI